MRLRETKYRGSGVEKCTGLGVKELSVWLLTLSPTVVLGKAFVELFKAHTLNSIARYTSEINKACQCHAEHIHVGPDETAK